MHINRQRYFALLLLIAVLMLNACDRLSSPSPTATVSQAPRLQVTVSEALVFEYPSRESNILFRLIEGDQTTILAQTPPDLIGVVWYQIGQGNQFGWVAGSQVNVSGDLSRVRTVSDTVWQPTAIPATATDMLTPTRPLLADQVIAEVMVAQATVFDLPSRTAAENTRLFEGEIVDVIGRVAADEQGDIFYFVGRNNTVLGWVLDSQVTVYGDLEIVPLLENVDVAVSTLVPEVAQGITPGPTAAETATPTTAPTAEPSATPADTRFTPPPTATPRISLTPSDTPDLASTSQSAPTATAIQPTLTPTPRPTGVAALQVGVPPPLDIDLPDGWEAVHILAPIGSEFLQGDLPVSIYQGPLQGGTFGTIWIIWGFPNVTSPTGDFNYFGDGIQLLRGVIFDSTTCSIGLGDDQRIYAVDGLDGFGTQFSAVNCEGSSDITGFFTVVPVGGGTVAFFLGMEPPELYETGIPQLESILDTVRFRFDDE